jgi:hypothetical protein
VSFDMAHVPQQRSAREAPLGESQSSDSEAAANDTGSGLQDNEQPVFRAFSMHEFRNTPSWDRLARILRGNGGCYGLFGPRGSGKSWLMMRAISEANSKRGLGLWFPCPSRYDASTFLSTLSDNLANAVERRFIRNSALMLALRRGQALLICLVVIPITIAVVTYAVRDFTMRKPKSVPPEISAALPGWLWFLAEAALGLLIFLYVVQFVRDNSKRGQLVREATALRERIRFSASLRSSTELGLNAPKPVPTSLTRSREKSLDERPTTIASLVFDFRNLAERIADTLPGLLIIGIDELDKIELADSVRELLRDIKGIFEVTGVHFLVSISEEAAATLQLGTLQSGGRNEFNSSFYTVIELPPLEPTAASELLQARGFTGPSRLSEALCLLSGGNRRELIRMADLCAVDASRERIQPDESSIIMLMERESRALLQDIIRRFNRESSLTILDDDVKYETWMALPRDAFTSMEKFVRLGRSAIVDQWVLPYGSDSKLFGVQEAWRRLLVRLFVSAKLLTNPQESADRGNYDSMLIDLRDILLMAINDAGIAKLMLRSRFGEDLSGRYRP